MCGSRPVFVLLLLAVVAQAGCGGSQAASGEPAAKQRITQLLRLYLAYQDKHKKAPASEKALRDFAAQLTPPEREAYLLGDDLESIFTSPRDKQKFEVRYKVLFAPAQNRAVAWEATGQNGRRFVALSIGYVEEYDDETFQSYRK